MNDEDPLEIMAQARTVEELAKAVEGANPSDAAVLLGGAEPDVIEEVLRQLPAESAVRIAAQLPGATRDGSAETAKLSAGLHNELSELMQTPPAVLKEAETASKAVDYLVHSPENREITYFYVVNAERKLTGVVVMRDLLLARPGQTLAEIMVKEPFSFAPDTPLNKAVQVAIRRHYPMYPVVDKDGRLVGVVRAWALYHRLAFELTAQTGSMVGLDRDERVDTPWLEALRMRHPWLQFNLVTAFGAAIVVAMFEDTIARIVALAAFLPVLAGQSGNTGGQALAITLRGMTLGELGGMPVGRLLRKEILLGAVNGFLVGLVAAVAMAIFAAATDTPSPMMLAFVILLAMTGACIGSGMAGVLVPLTLRRFGADPAMASNIFLTTITDIVGMGLMLFLATRLVP